MKLYQNNLGQGLLETIIAIGVIMTGLVGAVSLINYTVRSTASTENRLIALNLAWEGIEVAINIRDTNYLQGVAFDTGLNGAGDDTAVFDFNEATNFWTVDFSPNDFTSADTVLYRQGGLYRHAIGQASKGAQTQYKRLITLDVSIPDTVAVTSTVQWNERGFDKQISAQRILYDWR